MADTPTGVTVAFSSQGSKLMVLMGSPPEYKTVRQLKGFKTPSNKWDIADKTCLSSPSNSKEKQPLMKDPGNCTGQLVFDPANEQHEYLRNSNNEDVLPLEDFKVVYSDTGLTERLFQGYVTGFDESVQSGQMGMVDLEITASGAITTA
jgi:hypothetical protein